MTPMIRGERHSFNSSKTTVTPLFTTQLQLTAFISFILAKKTGEFGFCPEAEKGSCQRTVVR